MASKEEIQIILDAQIKNGKKTIDAVKKLEKNIKGADKSIKQAEKSSKFFSTTLGKIAGAVGIGYAINSFKNLGKNIVLARANMEQFEITFGTMLGSMEKGKNLLSELEEFSTKTPFKLEGLNLATKQLLNANVATKEIIPTLTGLGDIAAGLGQPIERMAFLFARVKQNGKLMGDELNMFVDAGIPMIGALSEELGIAEDQVRKFGADGKISFQAVQNALEKLSKTKFANLMEKQNNSVLGQFSNLQVAINRTFIALGKPLEKVIKSSTTSIGNFFDRLTKTIEENEDAIREWVEGFMEGVLTAFDVLKRFGGYAIDFFSNSFVQAVGVALVSWKAFSSAMTLSLGGITKALALVGGAIAYINSKIESGVDKTFKSVSDTAKSLKGTYDQLKNSFGGALGFNVENKTTTATDELATKTTKKQTQKTGEDEKTKEKKLKNDLLAIDKDYNTKKLNQQAKSVEKQNELNHLASWGYYDEAEKKIEAKELELNSLKEVNDLELEQQKEKLDLLREIKAEDNELVLEQEAEFRLIKAEQEAEFNEQQDELKQARENLIKQKELQKKKEEQRLLKEKQLSIELFEDEKFKMVESGLSQIVNLTNSKNKELNRIGQAAAIAQIGISTAKGAVEAFNSASFLPAPANIIVGGAMAGTVIAYGAEQISNVAKNSFAVGSPNIEQDQLANIHRGEIIVPKTFSDGLRDGELTLGSTKSLDNQQNDEQRRAITIVNNFEGANFYGVADKDEMIRELSEDISEKIADGIIQPFPSEQL